MNLTVKDIENAIVVALAPMLVQNGGKARLAGSYGGQFEKAALGEGQIRLVMPAVLVTYIGSQYDPSAAPTHERTMTFRLYHGSANPSSELARRHEAIGLMEASKKLLNGATLALAVTPLTVEREASVPAEAAICVYAADYRTSMIEDATLY
jgi:phage gp37-like protein